MLRHGTVRIHTVSLACRAEPYHAGNVLSGGAYPRRVYGFGGQERWNGMVDWTGLEWNGMERPDKLGTCGRVRPLPLKFGCTVAL